MTREEVYKALDSERNYQDKKWGGKAHDEEHSIMDFINFMESYIELSKEYVYIGSHNRALGELGKAAALAVACFEVHGIPNRK